MKGKTDKYYFKWVKSNDLFEMAEMKEYKDSIINADVVAKYYNGK